jgi:hypothetical protein
VYNAVDAADFMQNMLKGYPWTYTDVIDSQGTTVQFVSTITVDPLSGCVSYQQQENCIILSVNSAPRVQCVAANALPSSFIKVEQVRRDAREMKLNTTVAVHLLTASIASFDSVIKLSSPVLQFRMCLVLNAAAACAVFGRRTARAHYLQPPPQLGFKVSQRLLELASLQPWCHGNKQRARLLCCCHPLSNLALRLAREVDREGGCRLQWSAVARIMARCLAVAAAFSPITNLFEANIQLDRQQARKLPSAAPAAAAPAPTDNDLIATLAHATPEQQKQMLGERLYMLIVPTQPQLAGKITGMLLEALNTAELLGLIDSPLVLDEKIELAIQSLRAHSGSLLPKEAGGASPVQPK